MKLPLRSRCVFWTKYPRYSGKPHCRLKTHPGSGIQYLGLITLVSLPNCASHDEIHQRTLTWPCLKYCNQYDHNTLGRGNNWTLNQPQFKFPIQRQTRRSENSSKVRLHTRPYVLGDEWIECFDVSNFPGRPWWVHAQVTWCNQVQLRADLRGHATNENGGTKRSRDPNIPWGPLDGMCSTSRDIYNYVSKPKSYKHNLNIFPFIVAFSFCSFV